MEYVNLKMINTRMIIKYGHKKSGICEFEGDEHSKQIVTWPNVIGHMGSGD
jgi:hypothetical protein